MGCFLVYENDREKETSELVVLGCERQLKRQMDVSLVCPWAGPWEWQAAEEADGCHFGLSLGW